MVRAVKIAHHKEELLASKQSFILLRRSPALFFCCCSTGQDIENYYYCNTKRINLLILRPLSFSLTAPVYDEQQTALEVYDDGEENFSFYLCR
jgi:hypothetical protein